MMDGNRPIRSIGAERDARSVVDRSGARALRPMHDDRTTDDGGAEEKKQLGVEISAPIWDALDAATVHGEKGAAVERAIMAYLADAAGADTDALRAEREDLRETRDALTTAVEHVEQRERAVRARLDAAEEGADVAEEREQRRQAALDACADALRDGGHLFPGHGDVETLADALGCTPADAIDHLQERHSDVPEYAFKPGTATDRTWYGARPGPDGEPLYPSLTEPEHAATPADD